MGSPRIFVLRNNDIGDLIVVTPLFEALRRLYPHAETWVGTGKWNMPVLENNPFVAGSLPLHAPWHNGKSGAQGKWKKIVYLLGSREISAVRDMRFEIGIDVLGSKWGSALLWKAGIPRRISVRGYAGGEWGAHEVIDYDPGEYVGRSALRLAGILGLDTALFPAAVPQLYLNEAEKLAGVARWRGGGVRVVLGFGGGYPEKCWPLNFFRKFLEMWEISGPGEVILAGGPADKAGGERLVEGLKKAKTLAASLSLRDTFTLVSASDLVISNSSMLMHVAAAFSKPAIVTLGGEYPSASAHARQWAISPLAVVCGKEEGGGRREIYTPEEVYGAVLKILPGRVYSA